MRDGDGDPSGLPSGAIVLARCTYPAGRILGRVALRRMPAGPVCWSPGRAGRILFASGDGRLYRYDLPSGDWDGTPSEKPRPIRWACGLPAAEDLFFQDPCWPAGPSPACWLLAADRVRRGSERPLTDPRLWWLRLDAGEGAIVEARRAVGAAGDGAPEPDEEERLPQVGPGPDGRWLAYLVRRRGESGLDLRVAPPTPPATAGGPVAALSSRRLAEGCLALAPVFSPDGRWIYAARPDDGYGVRLERFAASPERGAAGASE
jgi:hypothetical protein